MIRLSTIVICAFLFLFIVQVNAQSERQRGYVINGTIKGVNSGTVRMLSGDINKAIDSAIIVNGQFTMLGKIDFPQAKGFMIVPGNWSFRAFVEDTVLTFSIDTADAQHQYVKKIDYPMIWVIKETGSEMADVYTQYQNETDQAYYLALFKKLKTTNTVSDRTSIMNKMDSVRTTMSAKEKVWLENYVRQHPSGIAGPFIFNELFDLSLSGESPGYLQSVIDQFSGRAKTSIYYEQVAAKVGNLKNKEVNTLAPDFTLLKRDKTKFTLSSTRGKFTMIDFWASWCAPCRAGIPHWKKVYEKYHQKGFEIVSVSDDEYWKDWIPALNKEKMPWIQVIDEFPSNGSPAKVISLYAAPSMPFFVLLDKDGKILLASGDEDLMTKKIEEVLQ